MTHEHSMMKLKLSLIDAIDKWFEEQSDNDMTCSCGWVGYHLSEYMADAAMSVLQYGCDVNKVCEENNG